MSEAKPTPGPWRASRKAVYVNDMNNRVVAEVIDRDGAREANATLIAAAPGMLKALEAVRPLLIPGMNWTDDIGRLVKGMVADAIAKAVTP